jgi:hypothetical protein
MSRAGSPTAWTDLRAGAADGCLTAPVRSRAEVEALLGREDLGQSWIVILAA